MASRELKGFRDEHLNYVSESGIDTETIRSSGSHGGESSVPRHPIGNNKVRSGSGALLHFPPYGIIPEGLHVPSPASRRAGLRPVNAANRQIQHDVWPVGFAILVAGTDTEQPILKSPSAACG